MKIFLIILATDLDKNTPLKPFYFYGNDKDGWSLILQPLNIK